MSGEKYRPYVVFAPTQRSGENVLRERRREDVTRGETVMPGRDIIVTCATDAQRFQGQMRRSFREVLVGQHLWPPGVQEAYRAWSQRPY